MTVKRVNASADIAVPVNSMVRAIVLTAGSAAATLAVFNGTQTGVVYYGFLGAITGNSSILTFPGEKGLQFRDGVSVTITGTGADAYIYYD